MRSILFIIIVSSAHIITSRSLVHTSRSLVHMIGIHYNGMMMCRLSRLVFYYGVYGRTSIVCS